MGILRRKEMKRERKSAIIELLRLWPLSIFDRLGLTGIGILKFDSQISVPCVKTYIRPYLLDVIGSIYLGQDDR